MTLQAARRLSDRVPTGPRGRRAGVMQPDPGRLDSRVRHGAPSDSSRVGLPCSRRLEISTLSATGVPVTRSAPARCASSAPTTMPLMLRGREPRLRNKGSVPSPPSETSSLCAGPQRVQSSYVVRPALHQNVISGWMRVIGCERVRRHPLVRRRERFQDLELLGLNIREWYPLSAGRVRFRDELARGTLSLPCRGRISLRAC